MKLLILGSSGLLGNTLTRYFLKKQEYETFGYLRDSSKLKFFSKKYKNRLVVIEDFLDLVNLKKNIKDLKPDVIINCVGQTNKVTNFYSRNIYHCIAKRM